ncbi:MAG: hypothetical protein EBR82_77095, partial [Caulobacteraceae bacterium]|nr:hypothetical protein [Caulobacteraceae bacterium]
VTIAQAASKKIKHFRVTLTRKPGNKFTQLLVDVAVKIIVVTITHQSSISRITIVHLMNFNPKHTSPDQLHQYQSPLHLFQLRFLNLVSKHTIQITLYSSLLICSVLRLLAKL